MNWFYADKVIFSSFGWKGHAIFWALSLFLGTKKAAGKSGLFQYNSKTPLGPADGHPVPG